MLGRSVMLGMLVNGFFFISGQEFEGEEFSFIMCNEVNYLFSSTI